MSSIRKESFSSSSTRSSTVADRPTQAAPTPEGPGCQRAGRSGSTSPAVLAACRYPPSSPHRAAYLAARSINIFLGLALIVLSVVAHRVIGRDKWMSPILSPAINVLWPNGLDIYFIKRRSLRAHPLNRMLYDGAVGIGFAIAAGFLVSMTLPDLAGTREGSSLATAAVGAAILFGMFSVMLLEFGFAINGTMQWIEIRRTKRTAVTEV